MERIKADRNRIAKSLENIRGRITGLDCLEEDDVLYDRIAMESHANHRVSGLFQSLYYSLAYAMSLTISECMPVGDQACFDFVEKQVASIPVDWRFTIIICVIDDAIDLELQFIEMENYG